MLGRRIFDGLRGRSVNRGRILDVLAWRFMYQMIVMIFVLLMRFVFRRRIFVHRRRRVSSATVICLEAYDCEEGEQQKGMSSCHVRQHENGYTVMECNWKWRWFI